MTKLVFLLEGPKFQKKMSLVHDNVVVDRENSNKK